MTLCCTKTTANAPLTETIKQNAFKNVAINLVIAGIVAAVIGALAYFAVLPSVGAAIGSIPTSAGFYTMIAGGGAIVLAMAAVAVKHLVDNHNKNNNNNTA